MMLKYQAEAYPVDKESMNSKKNRKLEGVRRNCRQHTNDFNSYDNNSDSETLSLNTLATENEVTLSDNDCDDDDDEEEEEERENGLGSSLDDESLEHEKSKVESIEDWGRRPSEYYEKGVEENDEESVEDEELQMKYEEAINVQKKKLQNMPPLHCLLDDSLAAVSENVQKNNSFEPQDFENEVKTILDGLAGAIPLLNSSQDESNSNAYQDKDSKIQRDHPELLFLLKDLKSKSTEVMEKLNPLLERCQHDPELLTQEGLSYLEMRSHLLLCYIQYLCYYLLLKLHGHSIRDHPVLDSLIELRVLITQLKPIEARIQPQIQHLLEEHPVTVLRARTEFLKADESEDSDSDLTTKGVCDQDVLGAEKNFQVYKTPKVLAVHYNGMEEHALDKKKIKEQRYREKRLQTSEAAKALQEEFTDAPLEIQESTEICLGNNAVAKSLLKKERLREIYEEETMSRLPVSKSDKKDRKLLRMKRDTLFAKGSVLSDLTAFADQAVDVQFEDPTLPLDSKKPRLDSALNALKVGKNRRERLCSQKAQSVVPDAYIEMKSIKRHKQFESRDEYFGGGDVTYSQNESDVSQNKVPEIIQDALILKESKKKSRSEHLYQEGLAALPKLDETVEGKRKIGYSISKNKGLMRKRKKIEGHARVHNRQKYQRKIRSWKGIQQGIREPHSSSHYEGETTGIKTHLKKSVTFAS